MVRNEIFVVARKKAGLSQRGLARELGIGAMNINYYESRSQTPRPKRRKVICDYFGISEEELFPHSNRKKYLRKRDYKSNVLVEIRTNLGLAQYEVAKKMGISKASLCHYENLKRGLSKEMKKRVLEFYKTEYEKQGMAFDIDGEDIFSIGKEKPRKRREVKLEEANLDDLVTMPVLYEESLVEILSKYSSNLTRRERIVITLKYLEGIKYREIGKSGGYSKSLAKMVGDKALEKLQRALRREGYEFSDFVRKSA